MKPSPIIRKPALKESEVQRQILDWLELKHIFHWRNNTGAMGGSYKGKRWFVRFGRKGAPDIFAVHEGRAIGIEVKKLGQMLSEDQKRWLADFSLAGGRYILARSLEDVTGVF